MTTESDHWISRRIVCSDSSLIVALNGYGTVLDIVAGITSRVMIGLPEARSDDWLQIVKGYTFDVMAVSMDLRPYPVFLRPLVYPWLHSVQRLKGHVKRARRILRPVFELRKNVVNSTIERSTMDIAHWMVHLAKGIDRNLDVLTLKMLFLTLASVHTSTMSISHAIFDLCAMPEYAQPLREELTEVIGKYGWTVEGIYRLKKLDSFIKESQRMNHPGLCKTRITTALLVKLISNFWTQVSFNRKVMQDLHLSDGSVVPANSFISMATNSVARDPMIYESPDKFEGLRFYEKRSRSPAEPNRHQFVSTGSENLAFGHGSFSCPGRFFAAALVKVVLGEIILKFDISFPNGQTDRPENAFHGESIGPDRSQFIVMCPCKPC